MVKHSSVLIAVLAMVSMSAYGQGCLDNMQSSYCKIDSKVDLLIGEMNMSEFANQDQLLATADSVCDGLLDDGQYIEANKNMQIDTLAEEVCINKMSMSWMQYTYQITQEKIDKLADEVKVNNASLESMNQLISDKRAEIEALKQ